MLELPQLLEDVPLDPFDVGPLVQGCVFPSPGQRLGTGVDGHDTLGAFRKMQREGAMIGKGVQRYPPDGISRPASSRLGRWSRKAPVF